MSLNGREIVVDLVFVEPDIFDAERNNFCLAASAAARVPRTGRYLIG